MLLLAGLAVVAFFVIWLLAVHTDLGQRADQAAIDGAERASAKTPEGARDQARSLLEVVSVGSLAAAIVILGCFAYLRGRKRLILVPGAVIGISVIATELFKKVIFGRPDLAGDVLISFPSYPSGHTTIALSLGLAVILVAPARLRVPAAAGAVVLGAGMGIAVVAGVWHRPSDALGSFALTVGVTSLVTAAVLRRAPEIAALDEPETPRSGGGIRGFELAGMLVGALAFVGAIVLATLRYGNDIDWTLADAAFLLSAAAIIASAAIAVGLFARAVGTPDLQ